MKALPVIIVGAGGHAAVVADALLASERSVIGFVDQDVQMHGRSLCGLPVLGDDEYLSQVSSAEVMLVNGIGSTGDPCIRVRVQQRLQDLGWRFAGVIHPSATISNFAGLPPDVQVLARSVIQPNALIEVGCIVNTGAIVEHDVAMGSWSHVAPGAVICGGVRFGSFSHIGAGAVVMQGIQMGPRTLVGAGAVVVRHFEGHGTLLGVPARKVGN